MKKLFSLVYVYAIALPTLNNFNVKNYFCIISDIYNFSNPIPRLSI